MIGSGVQGESLQETFAQGHDGPLDRVLDFLRESLPAAILLTVLIAVLVVLDRRIGGGSIGRPGQAFRRQVVLFTVTAMGLFLVFLAIPWPSDLRRDLLTLLGFLLSAAIALSATTFVGNAMAGVMTRAVRNFKTGDFIRVGEHFGRVTEKELFHTEIQTEDRDLITLPNLYLVTNPVRVIRPSGTILSATVSLGYDVPRDRIERLLVQAATRAGLSDPHVEIVDLLDHSVVYRVGGMLGEVKQLMSSRSRLRGEMLDALHGEGIEIVSPSFMNQRVSQRPVAVLPPTPTHAPGDHSAEPDSVAFDKADEVESLGALRDRCRALEDEIAAQEAEVGQAEAPPPSLEHKRRRLAVLAARIEEIERRHEEEHGE